MPTKPSIVYLAVNQQNGKRYIGVTSLGLALRKYKHEWEAQKGRAHCRRFHRAIRRYGPEAFTWTTLASFDDFPSALAEEIRLIATMKPEYNLTAGGQGSKGLVVSEEQRARHSAFMKGRRPSPETIDRIVAKNRGRKRTPEQRERMGAARRGKPFSAAHCANISKAKRGTVASPETRALLSKRGREVWRRRRMEATIALEA